MKDIGTTTPTANLLRAAAGSSKGEQIVETNQLRSRAKADYHILKTSLTNPQSFPSADSNDISKVVITAKPQLSEDKLKRLSQSTESLQLRNSTNTKKVPPPVPAKNIPTEKLSRYSALSVATSRNSSAVDLPAFSPRNSKRETLVDSDAAKSPDSPSSEQPPEPPVRDSNRNTLINISGSAESLKASKSPVPPPRLSSPSIPKASSLELRPDGSPLFAAPDPSVRMSSRVVSTDYSRHSSKIYSIISAYETPAAAPRSSAISKSSSINSGADPSLSSEQSASSVVNSVSLNRKEFIEKLSKQIGSGVVQSNMDLMKHHSLSSDRLSPDKKSDDTDNSPHGSAVLTSAPTHGLFDGLSHSFRAKKGSSSEHKLSSSMSELTLQRELGSRPKDVPMEVPVNFHVRAATVGNSPSPAAPRAMMKSLSSFSSFSATKKSKRKLDSSKLQMQQQTAQPSRKRWFEVIEDESERAIFLAKLSKEEMHRQEVMHEIFSTEEDYLKDLQMVVDVYIKPLQELKLKSNELTDIFSNWQQLMPVNKTLFQEFVKCKRGALLEKMGEAFLKVADFLKLYTMYCGNHGKAVAAIQKLQKSDQKFMHFIKDIQNRDDYTGLNLESYLLKPVQRICKYPLLLREILKKTPAEHPDYKGLEMAKAKIDEIVATVNERTKQVEVMMKTLDALSRIKGGRKLHSPTTKFLHEGAAMLRFSADIDVNMHKFQLFLFNDILAMTKPSKLLSRDKFALHSSADPESIGVTDIPDEEQIANALIVTDIYTFESFMFTVATPTEKTRWIEEFQKLDIRVMPLDPASNIRSKFKSKTEVPPTSPVAPVDTTNEEEFDDDT
eukprot:Partr_v1_DN25782_c0_g1_i1_m74648 putative guanine nucleotide exchange factor